MNILLIDLTCKAPYHAKSLTEGPIAGTEMAIILVAQHLAKTHCVFVAQHCRFENEYHEQSASYISLETAKNLPPDKAPNLLILVRKYQSLDEYASLFPKAKKLFWAHDLARFKMRQYQSVFRKHDCTIIAVSDFHKQDIELKLKGSWNEHLYDLIRRRKPLKVIRIYNPVPEDLKPDNTKADPNKLVFFSSPNKGLDETIRRFLEAKKIMPNLKLYIANPGYITLDGCKQLSQELLQENGVVVLGALTRDEVIQHVREAFCVFYPQKYKAETFGYIFAEANAVGTPVLAHDFGAAKETLNNDEQLVNAHNPHSIVSTLEAWQKNGRPIVYANSAWQQSAVFKQWDELIAKLDIN